MYIYLKFYLKYISFVLSTKYLRQKYMITYCSDSYISNETFEVTYILNILHLKLCSCYNTFHLQYALVLRHASEAFRFKCIS